jgi:flagellar biosynthesis protein FliP
MPKQVALRKTPSPGQKNEGIPFPEKRKGNGINFVLRSRFVIPILLAVLAATLPPASARADDAGGKPLGINVPSELTAGPEKWVSPEGLSSTIQVMLLLTVLSMAPAILLMTTCFVRVVVVLSMVRQALGTQQLPPNQVLISLAMFITLLVMAPSWKQSYEQAIVPYTNKQIGLEQAWTRGAAPIRQFMSAQIERTGNSDDVLLFWKYSTTEPAPASYEEVPLTVLLPAYMLSELKTAFLIGFQIYLPFLILDMVVASVMVSMGMLMLPPTLVSLPFKILLFVLVDGWHLVVGMLMQSFQIAH